MSLTSPTKNALDVALVSKRAGDEVAAAIANGLGSDPLDLVGLASTGLIARTGSGTSAVRTVTGTANQITVANGSGAAGNPTISLPATIDITTSYKVNGTKVIGAQGVAVADSVDTTDVVAQLNALLARLRAHGLIAT